MEEADAWHGRATGDTSDVWAMRLPGGILLQYPRVIVTGRAGLCRLAWLPEDDAEEGSADADDTAKLLRVEPSVMALEHIIGEENDTMLGFYPPTLGSFRCNVLQNFGEFEDTSMLEKLRNMDETVAEGGGDWDLIPDISKKSKDDDDTPSDDSGLAAIRNALKL